MTQLLGMSVGKVCKRRIHLRWVFESYACGLHAVEKGVSHVGAAIYVGDCETAKMCFAETDEVGSYIFGL